MHPALHTVVMAGGEKSIGKELPLVRDLSRFDSRTNQTQAVPLQENMDLHSPPIVVSYQLAIDKLMD